MSAKDTGGPAFPFPVLHGPSAPTGMTLRDYFAAKAMQGLCANRSIVDCSDTDLRTVPDFAYRIADAMLAARKEAQ